MSRRIQRLNVLLKRVLAQVIASEVQRPEIDPLLSITEVRLANDLRHAKVYVSIIAAAAQQMRTLQGLKKSCGFIAAQAAKRIMLRYFPRLEFRLDTSTAQYATIEHLLEQCRSKESS